MTTVVEHYHQQRANNGLLYFVLRIAYFIAIGIWLSGVWAAIAWLLSITIIGLPAGIWMLNHLPQISTLQPQRHDLVITTDGRMYTSDIRQHPFLLRAIYFILVGWWFSGLWLVVAWALTGSIIGLPFAFWMMNRVPGVMTLARS
jgi:uncharacterized membrane protein YccF (DUF307 family)